MYFDKIFSEIVNSTIGKQMDTLKSTLLLKNSTALYNGIFNNAIEIVKQLTFECIIETYHDLRLKGFLKGRNRKERVNDFEQIFDLNEFYVEYPTLQLLVKKRLLDFINYMNEIISNYEKDYLMLCNDLGVTLGELESISYAAGDLHDGKSVSIVNFENGKLVYKPHSLKTDLFINQIILFANKYLKKNIVTAKVLSNGDYGWQEFIEYDECESLTQIHSFYYRIGVYLAVFYLLSSTDMHHENLIANGENPIFFDTESISSGSNTDSSLNYRMLSDSVIQTAVLPEFNKDVYEVNFSAIFTGIISPEKIETTVLDLDEDNDFVYRKAFRTMDDKKTNVPKLNGKEIEAKCVVEDVVKGFKDFLEVVIENKNELLSIVSNSFFDNMHLRQIIRPTKVYFNFLQSSLNPSVACSLKKRDRLFDLLINNFTPDSKNGYLRVEREVEDLKAGNISKFYTEYSKNILFSNGDIICQNYYINSPKETVISKINNLDKKAISYQTRLIYMSLQSIYGFKDLKKEHDFFDYENESAFAPKEIIKNYANHIFDNIVPCGEGMYSFITTYPDDNFLKIKYAEPGLYHMGGLVWFLAMYSYYYDNLKASYVKGILDLFITQYFHKKNEGNGIENFSVFDGYGGLLYLTYNFGKAFNEKKYYNNYIEIRNDIIDYYLSKESFEKNDVDYIAGLSGIIYLISKIEIDIFASKKESSEDIYKLKELSMKYFGTLKNIDFNSLPIGVAHGSSGILLTLSSLYNLFDEKCFLNLIESILKNQTIRLRTEKLNFSWCKGYSGVLLSRVILKRAKLHSINIDAILNSDIDFLKNFPKEKYYKNMNASFCHGIAGNYEIFNICLKNGYDFNPQELEIKMFHQLKDMHWFNSTKCELDSFMLGNSGVAYSLMEELEPVPTFITFDCFRE